MSEDVPQENGEESVLRTLVVVSGEVFRGSSSLRF